MLRPQIPLQLPAKLLPILEPRRFKIMYGGRGGGKSHTAAAVLLAMGLQCKQRILCVREIQKSLAQSSMQVLKDYIERLGLGAYYEVLKSEIRGYNGTTFGFSGLQDHTADSIKSFESADKVWVEEAARVSSNSWNILIPTIRKAGSEIWATFNADQADDYVYDRFVVKGDPDAWVCEINWRDNPWFSAEMDKERQKLQAVNDDLYQHVWEGKCRSIAGLLFKRHWFKRYPPGQHPENLRNYIASDYAGGPDPDHPEREPDWTEHGTFGMDENGEIWVHDWWSGQEDPDTWLQAWLAMARRNKPVMAFEEKGVILRVMGGAINRQMRDTRTYVHREGLASVGSKADRAYGFAALAATGIVHIPECAWGDRLVNQLCAFNGQQGRTDDMVDACSKFAQGLDEVVNASPPARTVRRIAPTPFTEDWLMARERADAHAKLENDRYYR